MKRTLFLLAFALFAAHGFSQNLDSLVTVKAVDSLLTSAKRLMSTGKPQEALLLAQQAADISEQKWGENNSKHASALLRLAVIYHQGLKQFDKAEDRYLKAIDLKGKLTGTANQDYALWLQSLAYMYDNDLGDYGKAEPLFLKVVEIRAKDPGKEHPSYAAALYNLGRLYWEKGDYDKAASTLMEAKGLSAKTLGKDDQNYVRTLNALGALYGTIGDFSRAESMMLEAMEIQAKTSGKENVNYASSLNNLANQYEGKGDYAKAERMFLESKDIWAKVLGKEHPYYANALQSLGNLYQIMGNYAKAEQMFLEAKDILARASGKEHPYYAAILVNLATLYWEKGDYAEAVSMYLEAIEIQENALGKEHPDYGNSLNNLAGLYLETADYTKAEPLYLKATEIFAKAFGKESSNYAVVLHNQASLYYKKGDYAKAKQMFLEVLEIRSKTLGKQHQFYATTLHNLANVYDDLGDHAKAEELLLEAKDIIAKAEGKEHPDYGLSLNELAVHYQETNHIPESGALFLEMNTLNRRLIEQSATYSSENQMLAYLHTFDIRLEQFQSFSQSFPSPTLIEASFDNAIFLNGALLENARRIRRSVAGADSLTQDAFERWQGCRRRLANEYAKPIAERRYVTEVEAEADSYEKTLTRNLSAFNEVRRAPRWQDVQAALKPGEAAVEFIHYRYFNPFLTDSIMYAALVIKAGDTQPRLIPLFEEKELAPILRGATGGSNFVKINALYAQKTNGSKQKSPYELIWQPLEGQLTGSSTIYCAASGLLHRINLAAIPSNNGQPFSDTHQLAAIGSTRQLVISNNNIQTNSNDAYLAGGIRYDADSNAIVYTNPSVPPDITELPEVLPFPRDSSKGHTRDVLDYLPATAIEVREISQTLANAGFLAKVDTGFYATEEAFRQLGTKSPSPRIIHLATHGYFFPDPENKPQKPTFGQEPVFKMSEHPMIRSGLIMAGAKEAWLTGKHPEGLEDGILTAYEISQMNLSGTELVVLSACETGLGDILGNEGVYGLQRAFKIAGAKYLIMSLWKVDDRSTQEFMIAFYKHWLTKKQTIPEAFRTTQREMRVKHPSAYDWAGFVLIE